MSDHSNTVARLRGRAARAPGEERAEGRATSGLLRFAFSLIAIGVVLCSLGGCSLIDKGPEAASPERPSAPTLTRFAPTATSVSLAWVINRDANFVNYRVFRSTDPNVDQTSRSKLVFETRDRYKVEFVDQALTPDTWYYYNVFATNDNGTQRAGGEVRVKTSPGFTAHRSGDVAKDEVWTPAAGPVVIGGDLTIKQGVTVRVDPGTLVIFTGSDSTASGLDPFRPELIVQGTLSAVGEAGNPIVFRSGSSELRAGNWGRIGFESATGSSNNRLAYCEIRHAVYGVTAFKTPVTIEHCYIADHQIAGILAESAGMSIRHTLIARTGDGRAGHGGIIGIDGPGPFITNTIVGSCEPDGVNAASDTFTMEHSVVIASPGSGIATSQSSLAAVADNIVVDCGVGIRNLGTTTLDRPDFNDVFSKPIRENEKNVAYAGTTAGANALALDPKFVAENAYRPESGTFALAADSPLLRKGRAGNHMGLTDPAHVGAR